MISLIWYTQPPVELPLDGWLLEGEPVPDCKVCAALDLQRSWARKRNDWAAACAAAREIRNHGRGHDEAA
ncbi:hypothetical protein [Streptomyces sp. NRRL S-1813]|uniref:hypothetical protein n=1 Tax=Streptomyces sp. NRRL S-1813 TaxID=1463888 RepID=UPI0004C90FE2|nr:hypothetical protein [Streptomyces sp. NRRL S-1813]